jgi:nitrogen fixation/metabolism regulation signal transduction histidine kinase
MSFEHSAPRPPRQSYERRLRWLGLAVGLPGTITALALLWFTPHSDELRWTLSMLLVVVWLAVAALLIERVIRPLQTISNMLAALREGDFSMRASGARTDDALGLTLLEVNSLSDWLREQRLDAREATALLRTVMAEIDAAVFAFDEDRVLRLVNRGGERLLGASADRLLGRTAASLSLGDCLVGESIRTFDAAFPGGRARWEQRRSGFRQGGRPHQLLVITDVSRTLRAEERTAWQRLVRVLGHEINNSLTPIKSIAGSLRAIASRTEPYRDWQQDLLQGLQVIESRSEALARFMGSYALLTRLPSPSRRALGVGEWVKRVARLETRLPVGVDEGASVMLEGDIDQLEQLLINVVRNAADAALETQGGVHMGWRRIDGHVEVWVRDDGPGIADTANLFVPFFTTKPTGSGIGLVLSRQIAEAHGGSLTLENRTDGRGCVATLRLPVE